MSFGASSAALAATVVATAFPPVVVTVAPGTPCPTAAAVEKAIADVRGPDAVTVAAPYRLQVEGQGSGALRAALADAAGAPVWSRVLATPPTACGSAAEALALMVERQFREIAWRAPAPPESTAANPTALTPPAAPIVEAVPSPRPSSAAHATEVLSAREVPAEPRDTTLDTPPALVATLGSGVWTRALRPSLALDVRARLAGALVAGAGVLLPAGHIGTALGQTGGQANLDATPAWASLGIQRAVSPRIAVQLGGEALLTFEHGQTTGIDAPASAWRTIFAAGLAARGTLALGSRLLLDLRLAGYRTLLGRSYTVEGLSGNVLDPPGWQAVAQLGLGWAILP